MIDAEIYYGTQKEMVKGIIPGIYKCEIMKVNPRWMLASDMNGL